MRFKNDPSQLNENKDISWICFTFYFIIDVWVYVSLTEDELDFEISWRH